MRLGKILKKWRLINELDLRTLGKEIGISASTLMRLEMGHEPSYSSFKKILDWMSEGADDFLREEGRRNKR